MKYKPCLLILAILITSCSSQEKLAYLNNLPVTDSEQFFTMEIPDYKIQNRDILYITIKAMTTDGKITDFLGSSQGSGASTYSTGEAGNYLFGYDVDKEGKISIPVLGKLKVSGSTLQEAKELVQAETDKHFNNATVECKLLSFKFTVIGEVRSPGTFMNYNNYLTVLEAIGRAGGISDYGRRDKLLVVRPVAGGTKTYTISLQDKSLLSNEAYFLLPNDVVIVEPESKKIFNLNLPTFSFIISTATSLLTTTLLLIDYFGK